MTQHAEYALPGVPIVLPDRRTRVRAAVGVGCWLGAPPLLLRLLGRSGRRRELHHAARWWAGGLSRHLAIRLDLDGLEQIDPAQAYVVTPLHEGPKVAASTSP